MKKILIVHEDAIEAGKLRLVLSKYGQCEIAADGKASLAMFAKAYQQKAPYYLMVLNMDMKQFKGYQVVEAIRKWETDNKIPVTIKILMVATDEEYKTYTPKLEGKAVTFLVKPINRKKMSDVLASMNMEKEAPAPASQAPASSQPAASAPPVKPKTKAAAPTPVRKQPPSSPKSDEVDKILKHMEAFISDGKRFDGPEAHSRLKEMVKRAGKRGELYIGQQLTGSKLNTKLRLELFAAAGEIRSPLFLVPLNRIMDIEPNIKIVEASLITIGKYGDQRALNLLTNALKKIKNQMLLNTVRREIQKIKDNNPILSILPRFLQSYKNRKLFRNTIDIIKKIITPTDTPTFVHYLRSGNPVIEDGAFEILCASGDEAVKTSIFNYFEDRYHKIKELDAKECDELYYLIIYFRDFFDKVPHLIDEQISELTEVYGKINDIRPRQILISILSKSSRSDSLDYIKTVYNKEEEMKETIIEELSGNQQAVDFLFEKYHDGQEFQEKVVTSLLKSEQGLQYFIKHFFTFEPDKQELIIKNLSYSNKPYFIDFIRRVYQSQLYGSKYLLLKLLKKYYMFEFKDVLFDPDNEREFNFMGKDYFAAIIQLFPISTILNFFHKIVEEDLSNTKIKKYFEMIRNISTIEPALYLGDAKFFNKLFSRVYKANNIELNTYFFSSFENIKFLDINSYKHVMNGTNAFAHERGAYVTENEKGAITKLKQRLTDQLPDIRATEVVGRELNTIFSNKPINIETLEKFLKSQHMPVAMNIEKVCIYLASKLKKVDYVHPDDLQVFLMQFPLLARFMDYYWSKQEFLDGIKTEDWASIPVSHDLYKHFASEFRIVVAFNDRKLLALFRDQFMHVIPYFQVIVNPDELQEYDLVICDAPSLKIYSDKKMINKHRVYLYLEHRSEYAPFKELHPKAFMDPISGHRIVKMVFQELYLPK